MKARHLLMLGGWTETLQKALDGGFRVTYLGPFTASPTFDPAILARCAHTVEVAVDRIGACLLHARRIHAADPLLAAISFTELGMETAAVIADALGIQGLELEPVVLTRYKDLMRQALSASPQLALPWRRVTDGAQLRAFHAEFGPAIIVKPIAGLGSVGVHQIKSTAELDAYLAQAGGFGAEGLQAEQLADSDEVFSIETLSVGGKHHVITMSRSRVIGYPYSLVTHTMVPPPGLAPAKREAIALAVTAFLDVIRLRAGVAHTEVKVTADGRAVIIESQTRVGGDRIWRMLELTTGVRQIDLALASLAGEVSLAPGPVRAGAAAFLCLLPPPGRVRAVAADAFLDTLDGVLEWRIDIAAGMELAPIRDNMARKGFVLLAAADHAALAARIREVSERYWVEYDGGLRWHPSFDV